MKSLPKITGGRAYDMKGDTISAQKYFTRFYDLLNITYFSGNGHSTDSAFIVRNVDDEYIIIGELGCETESQAFIFFQQYINCSIIEQSGSPATMECRALSGGLHFWLWRRFHSQPISQIVE